MVWVWRFIEMKRSVSNLPELQPDCRIVMDMVLLAIDDFEVDAVFLNVVISNIFFHTR